MLACRVLFVLSAVILALSSADANLNGPDLRADGACSDVLHRANNPACPGVTPGSGRLAFCLFAMVPPGSRLDLPLPSVYNGGFQASSPPPYSDECFTEMRTFILGAPEDVKNRHYPLITSCGAELESTCRDFNGADTWLCLRGLYARSNLAQASASQNPGSGPFVPPPSEALSESCRSAIKAQEIDSAKDIALDPGIKRACEAELSDEPVAPSTKVHDVGLSCGSTNVPPGMRLNCLRRFRNKLSQKCSDAVFQRERDDEGDGSLDVELLNTCKEEIDDNCKSASNQGERLLNCLYSKRKQAGFGEACKSDVEDRIREKLTDARLNFAIMSSCQGDMKLYCDQQSGPFAAKKYSGDIIACLKYHYPFLSSSSCSSAVLDVVQKQASNFFLDEHVVQACKGDALLLCCNNNDVACSDMKNGDSILQCIKNRYDLLSDSCKGEVLLEAEVESNSILMKPTMMAACSSTIESACKDISDGASVIECLQDHRLDAGVSPECVAELELDMELTSKDYRLKYGITHHCEDDMEEFCGGELEDAEGLSLVHGDQVLKCLVENRKEIKSKKCRIQIKKYQAGVAENWRNSADLKAACNDDVFKFCPGIAAGHGRVHECLVEHLGDAVAPADRLSTQCAAQEFDLLKQEAEDIDVNINVKKACSEELVKWCSGASDEEGGAFDCLSDKLDDDEMSDKCAAKVRWFTRLQNRDEELIPIMRRECAADVKALCSNQATNARNSHMNHFILDCLVDNRDSITSSLCKKTVKKLNSQRASDYKADPEVAEKCVSDVKRFCPNVEPGMGRVHACLFAHLSELSSKCEAAEFKEQAIMSEDIDYNPAMRRACWSDVARWCKESDEKIACLQSHINDDQMSERCKASIEAENQKESVSIAFNPQLFRRCKSTVKKFAEEKMPGCDKTMYSKLTPESGSTGFIPISGLNLLAPGDINGGFFTLFGSSIECLTANADKIEDKACHAAVFKKEMVEEQDVSNIGGGFRQICQADLTKYCSDIAREKGKRLQCLVDHKKDLTPECGAKVAIREKIMMSDIMLNPQVHDSCENEMNTFCSDVDHGDHRIYKCLFSSSRKPNFGEQCKSELEKIGMKGSVELSQVAGGGTSGNDGGGGGGSAASTASLVISGPLAAIALFSLFVVLFASAFTIFRKAQLSKHNYSVVLPTDLMRVPKANTA